MGEPSYWTSWFAKEYKHTEVTAVARIDDRVAKISRDEEAPVTVVALGNDRITPQIVGKVFAETGTPPSVIVLVPRAGHYEWLARELAQQHGSTVLTMAELGVALYASDPRTHLDRYVKDARARFSQHNKVHRVEMLCESSMRVVRQPGMEDLVVAVVHQYDMSRDALHSAIDRHPDADVVMNSNPYGRVTSAAREHAQHAGVAVFTGRELMGAMNYTGARFANYTTPPPAR